MQFTDCQQTDLLFYKPYRLYRWSNCFTPWPTNRCIQLSDYQQNDYYVFSLTARTDRMIDLTDCISASILDTSGKEQIKLVWNHFDLRSFLSTTHIIIITLCSLFHVFHWVLYCTYLAGTQCHPFCSIQQIPKNTEQPSLKRTSTLERKWCWIVSFFFQISLKTKFQHEKK